MDLALLWFILIAVLWTGYLVLEGFDFGVGMLMKPLAKDDTDRRVAINTIAPVWDGNEVWLLTAGGATFAAFPHWYATMFSGFYLPLLLILLALIVRGVSFEYRHKGSTQAWRNGWDWCIAIGSWVPAILWGVAFANLVRGLEIDSEMQYVGGFWALLSPFALLGGLVTLGLFLTHGAVFLALKTSGDYQTRAADLAIKLALPSAAVAAVWVIWAQLAYSRNAWTWAPLVIAALALVGVVLTTRARREGWAFTLNAVAIAMAVVFIFGSIYPNVMPANDPANSLTIANSSSSDYTLMVMTWVAVFLVPLVLLYQGWSFHVFRKRLSRESIPSSPPPAAESESVGAH
ncbi:cytochrome d ubiquinol oxidase subunit II [Serinibacter salmoneus]|uniref:Cytochrome bd-I ubiquinol oxidase subunit 2 apoprotein n=1 Tax=Serinibacter salmoneus TaxID=556530 RepID=A0A2A9D2F2_9MICO|nr:cytochrome d ubiquinol oxidase subunit II [Serinibacter salmoneus]PFG20122.1 cytochrome bd-I ubiquinol oxidase subunit 2 apoprotein [Serinibacter salmoneus]